MHLIRSGALEGFEKLVHKYGGNSVALIQEVGLCPAQFRNPNAYISYSKMAELLERAAITCDSPFFGLLLAPRQNMGVFGDLVSSVCQEPTVGEAISKMNQYLYLHASGIHITQVSQGDVIQIEMTFDFNTPLGTNQLTQFSVGRMINLVAVLSAGDPYHFGVYLQQPPPKNKISPGQPPFSHIQFSSSFDGMRIHTTALAKKPKVDENALQVHFKEYLHHLKNRYPNNLQDQVKEIIGRLLPSGDCSMDKVAVNLDLHPRSLQRKLQKENTSYGFLLKQTRQTIAEQHLHYGQLSITDLALNLGYAETSVFSRHFKNWTGYSPKEWRQNQSSAGHVKQ